jgi:hypothetical protein
MTSVPHQSCWQYSMPFVLWVICFVPILAALWGWMTVYNERNKRPIFGSVIALALFTVCAIAAAGGTIYLVYFACVPSSTPWTSLPEYGLDGWVMLLAVASLIAGGVALARRNSRRLCLTVLLMSGWLFIFAFLHASTL